MREMLNWVRKNNKRSTKFGQSVVIFICCYLGWLFFICEDRTDELSITIGVIMWIAAFDVGKYFVEQYLEIEKSMIDKTELCKLMKYHAFDEDSYFSEIKKRMNSKAGLLGTFTIAFSLIKILSSEDALGLKLWMIAVAVLCVVAFYSAYGIKKKLFHYQLKKGTMEPDIGLATVKLALSLLEIMLIVCGMLSPFFLADLLVNSHFVPGMDNAKIVFRNSNGETGYIFMIAFIVLLLSVLEWRGYIKWKWLQRLLEAGCVLSFVVGMTFMIYQANIYTEFREKQFVVYHLGQEKQYEIEDMQRFVICPDTKNESVQIELEFKDGKVYPGIGSVSNYSEAYEEKYDSEYQFVADYIEVLQAAGVEGAFRDREQIEAYVQEFESAPEEEGWRKILEVMGEA